MTYFDKEGAAQPQVNAVAVLLLLLPMLPGMLSTEEQARITSDLS